MILCWAAFIAILGHMRPMGQGLDTQKPFSQMAAMEHLVSTYSTYPFHVHHYKMRQVLIFTSFCCGTEVRHLPQTSWNPISAPSVKRNAVVVLWGLRRSPLLK